MALRAQTERGAQDNASPSLTSRVLGFTGTATLVVVALFCAAIVLPRFVGVVPYTVATGSMEPDLPVGSLVYTEPVDPVELLPGDVVTFSMTRQDGAAVTHRVVSNDLDERQLVTQGDANTAPDPEPVPYESVRGKAVFSVPVLGVIASGLSSGGGKLALAVVVVGALVLCFAADRFR